MSWNSYSKLNYFKHLQHKKTAIQNDDESLINILICLAYLGNFGEGLVKKCILGMKHCFKMNVKFFTLFNTKKYLKFCSTKYKIPTHQKSNIVYTRK